MRYTTAPSLNETGKDVGGKTLVEAVIGNN